MGLPDWFRDFWRNNVGGGYPADLERGKKRALDNSETVNAKRKKVGPQNVRKRTHNEVEDNSAKRARFG